MKTKVMICTMVLLLSGFTGSVFGGTEGTSNTFYGTGAGNSTTGDNDTDTFIGYHAGYSNTEGYGNSFLGYRAGYSNTTGVANNFIGRDAGYSNTEGDNNNFIGREAGWSNTTGHDNNFLGYMAGFSNTIGNRNSFLGYMAGTSNITGYYNTFLGYMAGVSNTTGYNNSFLGYQAGFSNSAGVGNSFLGFQSGYSNTIGHYNTFLGYQAGHNSTGSTNVFLGYRAGYNETGSSKLYIDNSETSSPLIYGEFDTNKLIINGNLQVIGPDNGLVRLSNVTTDNTTKASRMVLNHYSNAQLPVYLFGAASTSTANFVAFGGGSTIGNAATQLDLFTAPNTTTAVGSPRLTIIGNGNVGIGTQSPTQPLHMVSGAHVTVGGVWTNASSREYKDNIRGLRVEDAIEAFKGLNPVTFNYKASANESHVGFIAEEVPELVGTKDRKGLSPMDIVAVLTKVVQEQQKTMQEQQDAISTLSKELKELRRELGR